MKIAVVGTSHVAMIKLGWDLIRAGLPEIEMAFFSSPGKSARTRKLINMVFGYHSVVPQPDEIVIGHDARTIDLGAQDAVLQVGYVTGEVELATLLDRFAIDGLPATVEKPFRLSRPAFDAFCANLAQQYLPSPEWRGWTGPRLTLQPHPNPDERCMTSPREKFQRWQTLATNAETFRVAREIYLDHFETALGQHGIALLRQPAETFAPNGLTLTSYGKGAMDLHKNVPLDEDDYVHMNADFGLLSLEHYFTKVIGAPVHLPTPSPLNSMKEV